MALPTKFKSPAVNAAQQTVTINGKTVSAQSSSGAQNMIDKAVQYNPKLNPKYDARSSMGAQSFAKGNAVAFKPGADMGHSLVGHELSHVVQQGK